MSPAVGAEDRRGAAGPEGPRPRRGPGAGDRPGAAAVWLGPRREEAERRDGGSRGRRRGVSRGRERAAPPGGAALGDPLSAAMQP